MELIREDNVFDSPPKPPCKEHGLDHCAECNKKDIDRLIALGRAYAESKHKHEIENITRGGFTEQQAEWILENLMPKYE